MTRMFLIEPAAENWGVGGGRLASDTNIGFKVNV